MVRTWMAALVAPAVILAVGCSSKTAEKPADGQPAATAADAAGHATQASHAADADHSTSANEGVGDTGSSASSGGKKLTAEEHLQRGMDFSAKGRRRDAIAAYTAALKQQPRMLPALLYRGGEHYARQDFPAAERDIALALEIDSTYAEAYILRAHLLGVKHDYQKAVEDFYTALKHPEREPTFAAYFGD
ncbi:MAG: hypothetical protein KY475_27560, partial [Planctomycetes bacterium]|nr:hypothetical protein [Planctomycetota bacterium]